MSTIDTLIRDIESHKQRIGLNWRGVQIITHEDAFIVRLALDIAFIGETVESALMAMLHALASCEVVDETTKSALIGMSEAQCAAFYAPRAAARRAARAGREEATR